jgi:hypothetical protein
MDAGLRCTVSWMLSPNRLEYLVANSRYAGLLNLDAPTEQRTSVALTASGRRLDLDSTTLFGGAQASFIEDADHIIWLQHEARVYVKLERAQLPAQKFEEPLILTTEPQLEESTITLADGRLGHAVSLTFTDLRAQARYRHRLVLDPGIDAGELSVRLVEHLLGDRGSHATSGYPLQTILDLVGSAGFPVTSVVEIIDEAGRVQGELGGFSVENVVLEEAQDEWFQVPPGYRPVQEARSEDDAEHRETPEIEGFTRLEPFWIETESRDRMPEDDDSNRGGEASLRMALPADRIDNGIDNGEGPDEEPEPTKPPKPPTTEQATYGLRLEQRLFDDLRMLVNRVLGPLAGRTFGLSGNSGLLLDWLPQLRAGVLASTGGSGVPPIGLGTFLFCLLHDVEPPALERGSKLPSVNVDKWGTIRGRGLLDCLAMTRAQELVETNALTGGMRVRLPSAVQASLDTAALAPAGTRWASLTSEEQLQVMVAVLLEEYGAPRVPPPGPLTFDWENLVAGELVDYTGTLTLPPAAAGTPGVCPLVTNLRCRSNGAIDGELMLGMITLNGRLNRRPGTSFGLLLGAGALVALIFPFFSWALPMLSAIGVFVALDTASLSMGLFGITAKFTVNFNRDTSGVFQPSVTVNLAGGVSVSLLSDVPTGIHQVVDDVLASVAESGTLLLDQLQGRLQRALTGLVRQSLGSGFPASMLRLGVPIVGGTRSGRDDQFVYLEATLAAPANLNVPMVTVPADTSTRLASAVTRLSGRTDTRHYLSLVSSQNTINVLLAVLWRSGVFAGKITDPMARNALKALTKPPYPSGASVLRASVRAVSPPRCTLVRATPTETSEQTIEHGQFELNASLALEPHADDRYEWTLVLRTLAQTVVGSALASSKTHVEIGTAFVQPLDVLADLALATAQVDGLKRVQTIRRKVTTTETTMDSKGHPQTKTITVEEIEELETPFTLAPQEAAQHAPLALEALRRLLGQRDTRRAPRRDGVRSSGASSTPDAMTLQTYLFDDTDPDDAFDGGPPAAYTSVDLGFDGGLLFQHLSLGGQVVSLLFDPGFASLLSRDGAGTLLDLLPRPNQGCPQK